MENNDQNLNNQVNINNSNVNQQASNNNNKIVFALMALIIVGLAGYIVYTKFIQKDDKPEPKPNNTQEQENNNSNQNEEKNNTNENNESNNSNENSGQSTNNNGSTNIVGTTYKTKDGKKSLKILKKNGDGYSAEYNGTKLDIYEYQNHNKYGVFVGDKAGNSSQCGEYYLAVNNQTQELINLEYGKSYEYIVEKVGNEYYFIKKMCASIYSEAVYNESLNKIANEFITSDKNNNFYAMKDGYITKFDGNGKELKHSSIKPDNKYDLALDGISIIDNNLYVLIEVSSKLYLYDFAKDSKIELNNPYKSYICPDGNCGGGIASMGVVGKKLLIVLDPSEEQERVHQNEVAYLYTPTNGKLDSIGNYLIFDEDKEYGEGNFYLYDDTYLYKYDNSGNLVTKTAFDYNQVVTTAATHGFAAYKGNFFVVIKEDGEYYLQDAFNKDKYKIDMVDGYEFYNMHLLDEHKGDRYVATNVIELSLSKIGDLNDGGSIKYKFNIDSRKMSK